MTLFDPRATKKEIGRQVTAILNFDPVDSIVGPQDTEYLLEFFEWGHPRWNEKRGCGISHITIEWNQYGGRGFFLNRIDGTKDVIGVKETLQPKTQRARAVRALRWEIKGQIFAARDKAFGERITILCPVTNRLITRGNADADHLAPNTFVSIVKQWAMDLEKLKITKTSGMLEDRVFASGWRDFHREKASYRIVYAPFNRWGRE